MANSPERVGSVLLFISTVQNCLRFPKLLDNDIKGMKVFHILDLALFGKWYALVWTKPWKIRFLRIKQPCPEFGLLVFVQRLWKLATPYYWILEAPEVDKVEMTIKQITLKVKSIKLKKIPNQLIRFVA